MSALPCEISQYPRLTYAAADSDLFLTPTPMSFSSVSPLTPPTPLTMCKKRSVPLSPHDACWQR